MVAVLLGAGGGSLLGLVTAPDPGDGAVKALAPAEQVAPPTTRRPRGRFAGVTSTTTRPRPRVLPAVTAGLDPATTGSTTTSTVRPTTTMVPVSSSTTTGPSTSSTTTTVGDGTTTSSSSPPPSTTSTT